MKKITKNLTLSLSLGLLLGACTPLHTESAMNNSRVEIARESVVEQIPMAQVNDAVLGNLAMQYNKTSNGSLDITLTYDPASKNYTAMSALHDLKDIKMALHKEGVQNVVTQTLAVPNGQPFLMVSYDTLRAQAPTGCPEMPGLNDNNTGRFIDDYKFGCGTESIIAQQIARPSDLEGKDVMSEASGRRAAIIVSPNASGVRNQSLQGVERDILSSE